MSSQGALQNTEAPILARIICVDEDPITPEVARYLLSMRLPVSDEERVNELSAKARSGTLTAVETAELDSYLHVGYLLGVLQAKARGLVHAEVAMRQQ